MPPYGGFKTTIMIYCTINGKNTRVIHTHPNNQGIITLFFQWDIDWERRKSGGVHADSFSLADFLSVEDYLKNSGNYKNVHITGMDF